MAKPSKQTSRTSKTSKNKSGNRRVLLFVISILLIGLMVWQVLLTLGASSRAAGNRGNVCRPHNDRAVSAFARLGFCHVDRPNACGDSCTCIPFRPGFKFGRCKSTLDVTPANLPPSAIPTAKPAICTADAYQCPDGSWVGRSGPNCQFVCIDVTPTIPAPSAAPTKSAYCTADAYQCPNGTWVGRSGPTCQFVCPTQ